MISLCLCGLSVILSFGVVQKEGSTVEQISQEALMKKPVFAMLLGGILGIFDGLSALISAPQEAPNIVGIVIGSTFKGIMLGAIVGFVALKTQSLVVGVTVGLVVGALLAYLVTLGGPYLWEIVLPGSIVGLIVGYATMKFPGPKRAGA
jgi:hypothetical protein